MIIDFLTTCSSIIKFSNFTDLSSNMKSAKYSVKSASDIKSWKLSGVIADTITMTVFSPEIKHLKEVAYNLVGSTINSDIKVVIETSLDYIHWNELPYVVSASVSAKDKHVYKKISQGTTNSFYNTTTKKIGESDAADDLYQTPELLDSLKYAFTKTNDYNKNVDYLYSDLEWKVIKITLEGTNSAIDTTTNSLFFSNLNIYIEEEFQSSLEPNILELNAPLFTKPKIFEENYFVPDMITNYLKMLEDTNMKIENIHYVNINSTDIIIPDFSPAEGIGNDFVGTDTLVYNL